MKFLNHIAKVVVLAALISLEGCKYIDDDISDCGADFGMEYELRLVTNISTELETKLGLQADIFAREALQDYLADIFTDHAKDVKLLFYDVTADSLLLERKDVVMDANQSTYTFYMPARHYWHNAVANLRDNQQASLKNEQRCHKVSINLEDADTVGTQKTGVFTARIPMEVLSGVNQSFDVRLYMANCATALVLDTLGSGITKIKVYSSGFARNLAVRDSLYNFGETPLVVRNDELQLSGGTQRLFAGVNLPSRDITPTKTIIETIDPFVSADADSALWTYNVYARAADGTITESVLKVSQPLRAGQLTVIKAKIYDTGIVYTSAPSVGVSVTLNWNHAGTYNPEL